MSERERLFAEHVEALIDEKLMKEYERHCPDCGAELWVYDLGYACYGCGARFGVGRFGDLFHQSVRPFRPAQ